MKCNVAVSAHNSIDWDRFEANDFSKPAVHKDYNWLRPALDLGDLAEPLGFDGIWVGQHFGTPYNLTPNPLQTLAYFAGRTSTISLGTIVLVLPWWNPIDLAHQIAYTDIISNQRFNMIGVGRGVAKYEYDALGLARDDARGRFAECLDVLELALTQERFEYQGEHFRIPETSIRPAPESLDLPSKFYGAASTGSSLELIARRGLKPLFVGNKSLAAAGQDVRAVNTFRQEMGFAPAQPNNILFMYCTATEKEAEDSAIYMAAANRDVTLHYGLNDAKNFEGIKGYEDYAAGKGGATALMTEAAKTYDESNLLIGTPDEIMRRLTAGQKACSFAEICIVPNIGSMPPEVSRKSLELFAKEVLPQIHKMDAPMHAANLPDAAA